MKQHIVFAALATLFSLGYSEVDRSAPLKTLESFSKCVEIKDYSGLLSCVKGAKRHTLTESMFAPQAQAFKLSYKIDKSEVGMTNATLSARVYMTDNGNTALGMDSIRFVNEHGVWLIVPENVDAKGDRYISQLVEMLAEPDQIFQKAKTAAIRRTCEDKMREVAIGMILLANKNGGVLKVTAGSWRKAVAPFIKNGSDFMCPFRKDGSFPYSFNSFLAGKSLIKLLDHQEMILLYEGKNGKLEYRHGGRAIVALTSGAVKSVTPEEAKKLIWIP